MKTPCLDCENRTERCHSSCEEYNEWKAEREALKDKERQEKLYRRGYYIEKYERKRKK